ncbi:MAG: hypothetical protein ACE5KW_05530 [Dehalococcoidia bacterium]
MTTVNHRPEQEVGRPDIGARLSFDLSRPGRRGCTLPALDVPRSELPAADLLRSDLNLPEMAQNEIVRYFLALSRLNYSVDTGFYPLGSCTMKYNPKVNEDAARLPGSPSLIRCSPGRRCRERWPSCTSWRSRWPRSPGWTP